MWEGENHESSSRTSNYETFFVKINGFDTNLLLGRTTLVADIWFKRI